jgi:hypothetical protein
MPDREAIIRGNRFEEHVSEISGGRLQPASGNRWYAKGDVSAPMCLIQAKASANRTWAQTRRELKGAIDDAIGTGKPAALAVLDDDGEALFVGRLDDVVEMLSSDLQLTATESSGEQRRRLASMPGILREEP